MIKINYTNRLEIQPIFFVKEREIIEKCKGDIIYEYIWLYKGIGKGSKSR